MQIQVPLELLVSVVLSTNHTMDSVGILLRVVGVLNPSWEWDARLCLGSLKSFFLDSTFHRWEMHSGFIL